MKKMLSLLLALVMVIGVFPAYADDTAKDAEKTVVAENTTEQDVMTAQEAGDVLVGYGAIKGTPSGDLMLEEKLKRQDAVVILSRLMGKSEEVMKYDGKAPFTDVKDPYYDKFIGYAFANSWIKGKSETTFGYNEPVKYQEFAAMLLRALGYVDQTPAEYAKTMDKANELGILKGIDQKDGSVEIVRGDSFIMMNNTLETPLKDGTINLVYLLNYKEEPKAENLVVESVEAVGLKVLKVTFSKPIDERTLKSIEIKDGKKDVKVMDRIPSKDGKSATLVLAKAAKQDSKYDITIENVKSEDKTETVEFFEGEVVLTDTTRPEILSAEALNPRMIKFTTTEPINLYTKYFKTLKEIEIDGKAVYGKIINTYENEFTLELSKSLEAKDYEVTVKNLRDFNDLKIETKTFDVTVVEDEDAPVLVDAKMITTGLVKVTFDEPLKDKGTFKVDGKQVTNANTVLDRNQKTVRLYLTKELEMGAIVEIKVEYKGQKDVVGNKVKDWEKFLFSVSDDTTIPTVEIDSVKGTKVKLKFDKSMNAGNGNYVLKEKGDSKVQTKGLVSEGKWDPDSDNTVLIFDFDVLDNKDATDYELTLDKFEDGTVRHNRLPKTTLEFTAADTKAPELVDTKAKATYNKDNNYVTILFNETMDTETLLDATNYTIVVGGKEYRLDLYRGFDEITLDKEDRGVKVHFVFDNDEHKYDVNGKLKGAMIDMLGLKDVAGNVFKGSVKISENGTQVEVEKATIVREDDQYFVKVKFSNPVTLRKAEDFFVTGAEVNYVSPSTEYNKTQKYALNYDFKFLNTDTQLTYDINPDAFISETGGNIKSVTGGQILDGVAPEIAIDPKTKDPKDAMVMDLDPNVVCMEFDQGISEAIATLEDEDGNIIVPEISYSSDEKTVYMTLSKAIKFGESYKIKAIQVVDTSKNGNANKFEDVAINVDDLVDPALKPELVEDKAIKAVDSKNIMVSFDTEKPGIKEVRDYSVKVKNGDEWVDVTGDVQITEFKDHSFNFNRKVNSYLAGEEYKVWFKVLAKDQEDVFYVNSGNVTFDETNGAAQTVTFAKGTVTQKTATIVVTGILNDAAYSDVEVVGTKEVTNADGSTEEVKDSIEATIDQDGNVTLASGEKFEAGYNYVVKANVEYKNADGVVKELKGDDQMKVDLEVPVDELKITEATMDADKITLKLDKKAKVTKVDVFVIQGEEKTRVNSNDLLLAIPEEAVDAETAIDITRNKNKFLQDVDGKYSYEIEVTVEEEGSDPYVAKFADGVSLENSSAEAHSAATFSSAAIENDEPKLLAITLSENIENFTSDLKIKEESLEYPISDDAKASDAKMTEIKDLDMTTDTVNIVIDKVIADKDALASIPFNATNQLYLSYKNVDGVYEDIELTGNITNNVEALAVDNSAINASDSKVIKVQFTKNIDDNFEVISFKHGDKDLASDVAIAKDGDDAITITRNSGAFTKGRDYVLEIKVSDENGLEKEFSTANSNAITINDGTNGVDATALTETKSATPKAADKIELVLKDDLVEGYIANVKDENALAGAIKNKSGGTDISIVDQTVEAGSDYKTYVISIADTSSVAFENGETPEDGATTPTITFVDCDGEELTVTITGYVAGTF